MHKIFFYYKVQKQASSNYYYYYAVPLTLGFSLWVFTASIFKNISSNLHPYARGVSFRTVWRGTFK